MACSFKKATTRATIVACTTGLAAACVAGPALAAARAPRQALTNVSVIQSQGVLNFAADNVAQSQGFFKKQGLNVKISYGAGDAVTDPAVLSGGDDFGIGTTLPLFTYKTQGKDPLIVAAVDDQVTQEIGINKSFAKKLGITPGMSIAQEFKKLKGSGANVGVLDIGGSLQLAFTAMASHYGLKEGSDYHFTAIKAYPSLIVAEGSDEVNLVVFGMPYGSDAVAQGKSQNFADLWQGVYAPYAGAEFGALFTSAGYAKSNPTVVKKMYTAIDQALKFIHTNPAQALKDINAADPGTPMTVLKNILITNKAAFFAPSAKVSPAAFKVTQTLASQTGISGATKVSYASLVWSGAQA